MISRRDFVRLSTIAGVAASLPRLTAAPVAQQPAPAPILPRRLTAGSRVGLVLPASNAFEQASIELAREQLEAIGFEVVYGRHVFDKHGYFAGTDQARADDINAMFADESIDGIFCYTGGWGSPRLLPLLDFENIRRNPKVFIGYSDITGLLNPITQRTGLVTFHGPVAASNIQPYTLQHLRRAVMSTEPIGVLRNPEKREDELANRRWRITTIRGGRATGRIVGGNLTLLTATMGTPYEIETVGSLLFLEDVREAPYRVDRMLTQLALGGKLEGVHGVVFGRCTDCSPSGPSFSIEEILRDRFEPLGVPVISNFAFGHIDHKITLPIGLEATLDADAGTVTIATAAVR
jgi:muramoyltetrapeptide carboxypeptidase